MPRDARVARTFVLVHGMSHGAFTWDLLAPRLERHGQRVMRMPCTSVQCLRDTAGPPARAAEFARRLGVTPIDMDCAHGPMLSAPDALARILEAV